MSTAGPSLVPIDPATVPSRTLRSGLRIPAIGMGTFGSDRYGPADIAEAVKGAIGVGYRLIDCAAVYGDEPEVGESLRAALDSGVPREDLFVMTKVWNDAHLSVKRDQYPSNLASAVTEPLSPAEIAAFYEHVRAADTGLIVATGERRTCTNVLLTIGIA